MFVLYQMTNRLQNGIVYQMTNRLQNGIQFKLAFDLNK